MLGRPEDLAPLPLEALGELTWARWGTAPHPATDQTGVTHRFPSRTFLSWHPGAALWSEEGLRRRLLAGTGSFTPSVSSPLPGWQDHLCQVSHLLLVCLVSRHSLPDTHPSPCLNPSPSG